MMECESTVVETNILHLPPECLFHIIKLAGCCSEKNNDVRLVCKHFYEVYCGFTSCGVKFNSVTVSISIHVCISNISKLMNNTRFRSSHRFVTMFRLYDAFLSAPFSVDN